MIVTLTANPSLDRTVSLAEPLRVGDVQSALSAREDAGGKGINVARVVAASDIPALAVLPLAADDPFDTALRATGVAARRVAVAGHVRANIAITDAAGVTTKLNLPGAVLGAADARSLIDATVEAASGARWLVLAGSLPPGVDDGFYVEVIRAVRAAHGASAPRIAVDTSGPALTAVVADAHPDLIKPNDEELAALVGVTLDPARDPVEATLDPARELVAHRVGAALVTLGSRGALLVDADGAWSAAAPRIEVRSTVGAGDSSLAGYLLADLAGAEAAERLRSAVRYGAAAASLPGTQAPAPGDLPDDEIVVSRIF